MVVDFPKMCAEEAELKRKQRQVDNSLDNKRALIASPPLPTGPNQPGPSGVSCVSSAQIQPSTSKSEDSGGGDRGGEDSGGGDSGGDDSGGEDSGGEDAQPAAESTQQIPGALTSTAEPTDSSRSPETSRLPDTSRSTDSSRSTDTSRSADTSRSPDTSRIPEASRLPETSRIPETPRSPDDVAVIADITTPVPAEKSRQEEQISILSQQSTFPSQQQPTGGQEQLGDEPGSAAPPGYNFIWRKLTTDATQSTPVEKISAEEVLSRSITTSNDICSVCEEPSAGFHFGAYTCEGCKSFFCRNHRKENLVGVCPKGGTCDVIGTSNRAVCKACRMRKCVQVGMNPANSRFGRRPSWMKNGGVAPVNASSAPLSTSAHQSGSNTAFKVKTDKVVNAAKRIRLISPATSGPSSVQGVDEFARRLQESLSASTFQQIAPSLTFADNGDSTCANRSANGFIRPDTLNRTFSGLCLSHHQLAAVAAASGAQNIFHGHLMYTGVSPMSVCVPPNPAPPVSAGFLNSMYVSSSAKPVMTSHYGMIQSANALQPPQRLASCASSLPEMTEQVCCANGSVLGAVEQCGQRTRSCSPVVLRSLLQRNPEPDTPASDDLPLDLSCSDPVDVRIQEHPIDLSSDIAERLPWDLSIKPF